MTKELKVIYENGMLRPLEPLPFEENEHLRVTVTRPGPRSPLTYNPRFLEMEWIRTHRSRYGGKYVALEGAELVGEGDSVRSVLEQARARGIPHPLVHYMPEEPQLPFGGW